MCRLVARRWHRFAGAETLRESDLRSGGAYFPGHHLLGADLVLWGREMGVQDGVRRGLFEDRRRPGAPLHSRSDGQGFARTGSLLWRRRTRSVEILALLGVGGVLARARRRAPPRRKVIGGRPHAPTHTAEGGYRVDDGLFPADGGCQLSSRERRGTRSARRAPPGCVFKTFGGRWRAREVMRRCLSVVRPRAAAAQRSATKRTHVTSQCDEESAWHGRACCHDVGICCRSS
mmetsp:Transcript_112954/g.319430  ORF Transcript_112954/g.319430 Transcript_112954/m.319430 type:complete len:232 (+) Transcript_112954:504-1199(+)